MFSAEEDSTQRTLKAWLVVDQIQNRCSYYGMLFSTTICCSTTCFYYMHAADNGTLWHPLAADPTPTSHIPTPLWPFWMVFGTTIKPRHSEHLGILSVNDACVGKAFKRSVVGLCDHRHTSLSGWQPLWSKPRDSITTMIGHTSHQNLCIYRVTACLLTKYL